MNESLPYVMDNLNQGGLYVKICLAKSTSLSGNTLSNLYHTIKKN